MSLDAGAIVAEAQLDISQFTQSVSTLTTIITKLDNDLKAIPAVKPKLDTTDLEKGTAHAKDVAGQLSAALSKLTGGAVNLDTHQIERAAATVNPLIGQMSEGFINLGTVSGLAGVGIAALAVSAGVALLKMGQDAEHGFRTIAQRTGESTHDLEELNKSLVTVGQQSIVGIRALADILATVRQRLDETGSAAEQTTLLMTRYARATGSDAVQATQDLTRIFNAFRVTVEDQAAALDALVRVTQTTGISQDQLRQELTGLGPILRAYGFSIQESAGFLGLLDKSGVSAQQTVFGLRKALGELSGPEAKQQLLDLIDALGKAGDSALATAVANETFGTRSAAALLSAARAGKLSAEAIAGTFEDSQGAVAKAADATFSAAQKLERAATLAEKAWLPVATAMAEAGSALLLGVVESLTQTGHAIDEFLASDRARKLTEFMINLGKASTSAPGAPTEAPPLTAPAQDINAQPIPGQDQFDAATLAAAGFTEKGLNQIADAWHRFTTGFTLDEQALIDARKADIAATEAWSAALDKDTEALDSAGHAAESHLHVVGQLPAAHADAAAGANAQAEADEKLLNSLLRVTNGQINFAKALDIVGTNVDALARITELQQAWGNLQKGIDELTNTQVKAIAIAAQHAAVNAQGAVDLEKVAAATQFVNDNLAAGLAIKEADAEANRLAVSDLKAIEAAMRSAAKVADDEATKAFTNIATSLNQGLSPAAGQAVEVLLLLGHTEEAAATAASQFGVSADQVQRWAEALERGGPAAELVKIQMQALTAATGAAGVALFQAREGLSALTTLARDNNGVIRLKVDIDIETAQTALFKLQQDFQDANAKRAQAETKATRDFQDQQSAAAQQQTQLTTDFQASLAGISKARSDSSAQLGRDIQSAVSTQNDAFEKISRARDDAAASFKQTVADTQDKLIQTASDLGKAFGEGVASIADKTQQAMEAFSNAQSSALKALSAATTAFNQQQVQNAFTASVALENAQNAQNSFTDFTSRQSAIRAAQIQAEGQAGLAQQNQATTLAQAQNSVAQQQLDATKALDKTMAEVAKETAKLSAKFAEDSAKAQQTANVAIRDAQDKLDKSNRDTGVAAQQATEQASNALREGQRQDQARQKALDDQAQAAQQKVFDALIKVGEERTSDPQGLGRTKAEQAFDEAEKARREEQRRADKTFLDEQARIRREIENAKNLKAIAEGLKRPNVTQTNGKLVLQETGLDAVGAVARALVNAAAGGL